VLTEAALRTDPDGNRTEIRDALRDHQIEIVTPDGPPEVCITCRDIFYRLRLGRNIIILLMPRYAAVRRDRVVINILYIG
jgi:hypothetical protein